MRKKRSCLFVILVVGLVVILLAVIKSFIPLGEKVAVVEIKGLITESRSAIDRIIKFKKDKTVKAIVLRIETPGGAVGPSQEIYQEVRKTGQVKKVVASMGSVAASGGYYIASAAHKIFANPGTITGSIGVVAEFSNIEELLKKIGLKTVIIKSGDFKDIGSPLREMTSEERELIKGLIDGVHKQFIRAVAEGRNLPIDAVERIADGRILTGEQAKELGLIDQLGNLQDAITLASKLAGIKGEPQVIYSEKKRPSIWDFLLRTLLQKGTNIPLSHSYNLWYIINQ
ncbi:MAG TPA: signal peptide peptidase SppA [Syntrophaceae bacterium]|nr:signal peptide peptidase SppA [Syntrophaceae bacterium]